MKNEETYEKNILLIFLAVVSLSGCSLSSTEDIMESSIDEAVQQTETEVVIEQSVSDPLSEPSCSGYKEYAAIFLENAVFYDAKDKEYKRLSDYKSQIFSSNLLNSRYDFFLVDIDSDGVEEVLFQYDSLGSRLILDYEDEIVYGYPFKISEMSYVSIDGSFRSSEAESGWSRINLSHGDYEFIESPNLDFQSEGDPERYLFFEENLVKVFLPEEFEEYQRNKDTQESAQAIDMEQLSIEERNMFKTVLSGNFSLMEDIETRHMFQRKYESNVDYNGECTWRYTFMDFNGDEINDLFIQFDSDIGSESALLYYKDGRVICAYYDTNDHHDFYYPLTDGRILYIYDYMATTDEITTIVNPDFTFKNDEYYVSLRINHTLYGENYYDNSFLDYEDAEEEGKYYYIREYDQNLATGKKNIKITEAERIEIEQKLDKLLVPESAWGYCSGSEVGDRNEYYLYWDEAAQDYREHISED